jgi:hypothetical protein
MDRRWLVAGALVALGMFLMLAANRGAGSAIGGLGTLAVLASAIPVRRLGWKLLLYVPAAYVVALLLSLVLAVAVEPLGSGRGTGSRGGCEDWTRYISEVNNYSPTLNSRLQLLNNPGTLTDARLQGVIDAIENDIANWRAADPPPKAVAPNDQLVAVLQGWVDLFEALRDGTYTEQMLFDLQREDDELERLTRQANADCAG